MAGVGRVQPASRIESYPLERQVDADNGHLNCRRHRPDAAKPTFTGEAVSDFFAIKDDPASIQFFCQIMGIRLACRIGSSENPSSLLKSCGVMLAMPSRNLGAMYGNGQGVIQDYVRAHMWANLAASKGSKVAAENRERNAKKMTTQKIAEAQKLARECQARDFKGC